MQTRSKDDPFAFLKSYKPRNYNDLSKKKNKKKKIVKLDLHYFHATGDILHQHITRSRKEYKVEKLHLF